MRIPWRQLFTGILASALLCATFDTRGADWPQWRYDEMRSAASREVLPRALHLQWSRTYPPLQPAWPDEPRQQIDGVYRPILVGKTLVFGSSQADCVVGLDGKDGTRLWEIRIPQSDPCIVLDDNVILQNGKCVGSAVRPAQDGARPTNWLGNSNPI
ncbi:MAG: hypothetical protein ACUVWX_06610 [Kiritimatiellia bacterium]